MPSVQELLAELDEFSSAERMVCQLNEAAKYFSSRATTVRDFSEFSDAVARYVYRHYARTAAYAESLDESRSVFKEL